MRNLIALTTLLVGTVGCAGSGSPGSSSGLPAAATMASGHAPAAARVAPAAGNVTLIGSSTVGSTSSTTLIAPQPPGTATGNFQLACVAPDEESP